MRHGKRAIVLTFLIPPLLLYAVFVISPYLQSFQVAMTDWRGLSANYRIVGLDNFRRLLQDQYVWNALKHNAILLLVLPVVTIALGLFFATMLNVGGRKGRAAVQGVRGAALYKVVYFFPHVLSVAIIGVLWQEVYAPNTGLLNGVLRGVGLGSLARSWLGDPDLAFGAVIAVMVWANVGFYVVLFGAAMSAIPRDIYEAALLDGASRARILTRVTIPLLWETIQVAWVYLAIIALDGFALVQIILPNGGPAFSTDVLGLRLYNTAFAESKFGYASAIGVAMFFLTLSIAVMALRATRRERVEY
jgi:N-acetylglucosamine transport system permease protein